MLSVLDRSLVCLMMASDDAVSETSVMGTSAVASEPLNHGRGRSSLDLLVPPVITWVSSLGMVSGPLIPPPTRLKMSSGRCPELVRMMYPVGVLVIDLLGRGLHALRGLHGLYLW
mgnify:CR=1 FL=1